MEMNEVMVTLTESSGWTSSRTFPRPATECGCRRESCTDAKVRLERTVLFLMSSHSLHNLVRVGHDHKQLGRTRDARNRGQTDFCCCCVCVCAHSGDENKSLGRKTPRHRDVEVINHSILVVGGDDNWDTHFGHSHLTHSGEVSRAGRRHPTLRCGRGHSLSTMSHRSHCPPSCN